MSKILFVRCRWMCLCVWGINYFFPLFNFPMGISFIFTHHVLKLELNCRQNYKKWKTFFCLILLRVARIFNWKYFYYISIFNTVVNVFGENFSLFFSPHCIYLRNHQWFSTNTRCSGIWTFVTIKMYCILNRFVIDSYDFFLFLILYLFSADYCQLIERIIFLFFIWFLFWTKKKL